MKHLKDAGENYVCEEENGIRPISKIDGEIIIELLKILDLRGGNKELYQIIKAWKKEQDGHVLDRLIQYYLSLDDETGENSQEGGKSKNSTNFLKIRNNIFQADGLILFQTNIRWKDARKLYSIVINPKDLVYEKSLYKDIWIDYFSEKDRNKDFEKIQSEMENNESIRFIKIE